MRNLSTNESSTQSCRSTVPRFGAKGLLALVLILFVNLSTPISSNAEDDLRDLKEIIKKEIMQELQAEIAKSLHDIESIAALKETIKREILEELRMETQHTEQEQRLIRNTLKNEVKEEIFEALKEDKAATHPQAAVDGQTALGDATGQILRRGQPLPGCYVKMVHLTVSKFKTAKWGQEFQTITDSEGRFHFKEVPVGAYKLKWQLPGDTGWILRLRDRPDVVVLSGQPSTIPAIETSRGTVPH